MNPRRDAASAATIIGLLLVGACGPRFTSTRATAPSVLPVTTAAPEATTATTPVPTPATSAATTTLAATTTSSPTTTTDDVATEKATITANWERFFSPTTSIADRVGLLENGTTLQQALEQRAKDPLQQQASAKVKAVELTAPDRATVTYDVYLNGAVALPDGQGIAVVQDGVWKVAADSFCALIALGATAPIPGCS